MSRATMMRSWLCVLLSLFTLANAVVRLKTGDITTRHAAGDHSGTWTKLEALHLSASQRVGSKLYAPFVVQVREPLEHGDGGLIQELMQSKDPFAHVLHFLPDNGFLIVATREAIELVRQANIVRWVGPLQASMKVDPRLTAIVNGTLAGEDLNSISIRIVGSLDRMLTVAYAEAVMHSLKDQTSTTLSLSVNMTVRQFDAIDLPLDGSMLQLPVLNELVALIAQSHLVEWIEVVPTLKFHNRAATSVVQAGNPTDDKLLKPFWDKGLTGAGQIIGVADSGLDYDHCFFNDPSHPVTVGKLNPKHRKIVKYDLMNPKFTPGDRVLGHGTHVVGTIAGSAMYPSDSKIESTVKQYNGIAQDAKIAFQQLSDGSGESFSVPQSVGSMLDLAADAGASIHSNSWGEKQQYTYDSLSRSFDDYLYKHEGFLVIIAAGNDGASGSGTVSSPGNAKNVLTVGAVENAATAQKEYFNGLQEIAMNQISDELCGYMYNNDVCRAFGTRAPCSHPLCAMTPHDCCLTSVLADQFCPANQIFDKPSPRTSINTVAAFSSRGLTTDKRIKPDVLAVGDYVLSSRSDGDLNTKQCSADFNNVGDSKRAIVGMSGTSMATPLVAGTAVLVRQYFLEGRYPDGIKNTSRVMTPKGSLVKAVIINSGQNVDRILNTKREDSPTPQDWDKFGYQGFGRVQLDRALPLSSQFNLFVDQDKNVSKAQLFHQFCFTVTKTLKATLTWMDPPASPQSAQSLVNDLDLTAISMDGTVTYSNLLDAHDGANNVEQVEVQPGTYSVIVSLGRMPVAKQQTFALVVTGAFTSADCGSFETCGNGCNGRGHCMAGGVCQCDSGRLPDCGDVTLEGPSDDNSQRTIMIIGIVAGVAGVAVVAILVRWRMNRKRDQQGQQNQYYILNR